MAEIQRGDEAQRVVDAILAGKSISRDILKDLTDRRTFGERTADRIASFGGSWSFILSCLAALALWFILNGVILPARGESFDPFPFILLNLVLSMLAALQAPLILMSQNRAAMSDRADAAHDYEVNLKAELEIRLLHEKLDVLRERQWAELVALQQRQIDLLERLLHDASTAQARPSP
ncbi:MAG: DUF1003 domain-containing protein [Nannocystis sp.]|nr:DUF1003 domain-containing protein [Nannocystis sp.]MBA3547615.1 DUF1003 domain-containing protein [Nannocystis sp.]